MTEIPHPRVTDSLELFNQLEEAERKKIFFIHLNHTNPLLREAGEEWERVAESSMQVAREGSILYL
jgi:pyrroloquinoline quinone biosynthesis protein B